MLNQARTNQSDPIEFFKKVTSNYSPKQLENIFKQAEQMGVPEEYITQVKEGINAK